MRAVSLPALIASRYGYVRSISRQVRPVSKFLSSSVGFCLVDPLVRWCLRVPVPLWSQQLHELGGRPANGVYRIKIRAVIHAVYGTSIGPQRVGCGGPDVPTAAPLRLSRAADLACSSVRAPLPCSLPTARLVPFKLGPPSALNPTLLLTHVHLHPLVYTVCLPLFAIFLCVPPPILL